MPSLDEIFKRGEESEVSKGSVVSNLSGVGVAVTGGVLLGASVGVEGGGAGVFWQAASKKIKRKNVFFFMVNY